MVLIGMQLQNIQNMKILQKLNFGTIEREVICVDLNYNMSH